MQHRVALSDLRRANGETVHRRNSEGMSSSKIGGLFWRYVFMIGIIVYSAADLAKRPHDFQMASRCEQRQ
jgi:hypothetical protein